MSLFDLKSRMADIPGIEGLTMQLANGRQVFTIGEHIASTTAFASDDEIEKTIRNALRLPSVALIPDKPKDAPMSITGAAHVSTSLKDMLAQRKQAMADGHAKLQSAFAKMDQATAALNTVGDKVAAEADDLMSSIGQFSNEL